MKKIILTILVAMSATITMNADEYLFSSAEFKSGGFGGFGFSSMKVNGKTTNLTSGGGGWVINDTFYVGGRGYSSRENVGEKNRFSYGGVELGYMHTSSSFYNPFISVIYGYGGIGDKHNSDDNYKYELSSTSIETGVQIKVIKWFRVVPFIGWTSIQFDENDKYKDSDFGGLNYGIRLDFGSWKK